MESASLISVQGLGSLKVEPDVMRLDIDISAGFSSHKESYDRGLKNTESLAAIMESKNLDPQLCRTVYFDLGEHPAGTKERGGIEYMLSQKILIDFPIDDALVSAVIRDIGEQIPGIRIELGFSVKEIQQSQLRLLERAVSDAGVKAKVMAEAAGCSLGRVARINYKMEQPEVYRHIRTIHSNEEAKSSTPGALAIIPEDFLISDTVEVTWYLK